MFLRFLNTVVGHEQDVIVNMGNIERFQTVRLTGENDGIHTDRVAVGLFENGIPTIALDCIINSQANDLVINLTAASALEVPIEQDITHS
jgi:hypothetical protein